MKKNINCSKKKSMLDFISFVATYLGSIFAIFYVIHVLSDSMNSKKMTLDFTVTYGSFIIAIGIIVIVYYMFKFKYSNLYCKSGKEKNKKKLTFSIAFLMMWGGFLILGYILQTYVMFTAPIYLIIGVPFGINMILNLFKKINNQ